MKKPFKVNNLYKKLFIIAIIIYVSFVFIKQEKDLLLYKREQKAYQNQVEEQEEKKKSLNETKKNINSKEYIEQVARDKLDMYLPNERVYIDKCN